MENSLDPTIIWFLNFVFSIKVIMIIFVIIMFLLKSSEYLTKNSFDLSKVIGNFVSSIFLELFAWTIPSFIIKIYGYETYVSDRKNSKGEKIVELTENEKSKKLNAYRKSNQKDILLANKTETEHYINYLKKNDLYKAALK